ERGRAFQALIERFRSVCMTVAYAHSRGVIHRDIKPSNILLGPYDETLVVDWGSAKELDDQDARGATEPIQESRPSAQMTTRTGAMLGTPAYMSPEQATGRINEVDRRSDVFGLGAILCEILTGEPPGLGADGAWDRLHGCDADPELVRLTE